MYYFLLRLLLAVSLSILSLSALALPDISLGLFGPGVQDGTEPFNVEGGCTSDTALADAGDDCGEENNQVRSQDTVFFNWSIITSNYAPGQENLKNVVLEQVLHPSVHASINFTNIPARCTPIGGGGTTPPSSITTEANGDIKLTCNLGEFNDGLQVSFAVPVKVSGESWNGESFTSTQRVYSNADDGTPNANGTTSPEVGPIQISARPMLDISASSFHGYYVYGKRDVGNGLENGYYTYYNLRVSTDKKTGAEAISQPFSFLSELTATIDSVSGADYTGSGMEYYMTQCIYNPSSWSAETYGKESYGSTYPLEKKVINSGTCAFTRTDASNAASAYTMTISGADLSGSRFPTKTIGGADLSAGPYYYINMRVQFFIPTRVIDGADGSIDGTGSIYIKNTLKNFSPDGVSGTSNYGVDNEPGYDGTPMPDGSISNNISPPYNYRITTRGSFSSSYYKYDDDTGWHYGYLDGQSWHTGGGLAGPGKAVLEKLFFLNSGATDLTDPRSCVVFDNTTMKLTDRGEIGATPGKYAYIGEYTGNSLDYRNYVVEYGHIDLVGDDPLDKDGDGQADYNNQTGRYEGKWDVQRTIRCDDNVTTWKTNPNDVVGGIDAVNMVRTRVINSTTVFEPADYLRLNTPLIPRYTFFGGPHNGQDIPAGTVLASFGSVRSDQWASGWTSRYYTPSPENSRSDGDRVTYTRVTYAINSESLIPVAAPGDTSSTIAGKPVVWKINSAISTILSTPLIVTNLKIIDELPPEVTYNKNCTIDYAGGTPADLVQYNTGRDGNPKQGYTLLTWNLGTWTANNVIPPRVICTDSDALAPGGTNVVNYVEIQGDGLAGAASERSDTHTITLEQVGSIQLSKKVDVTLDDLNDDQVYTLSWASFAASFAISAPTIIDVFPFNGDDGVNSPRSPPSNFTGSLELTGAPIVTWLDGAVDGAPLGTWYYTTDAPATINHNPDINNSNWLTEAALGGNFSNVTAVKFVSNYDLGRDGDPHQGMRATFTLQAGDTTNPNSSTANKPGDIYTNLFTLDTSSLPVDQFLSSNAVSVTIASYSVGDLIFADVDGDLKYTEGIDIPAPDGIVVELHKASDNSLVDTTSTGDKGAGRYLFVDIGSGDYYVTIPASQFATGAVLEGWNMLSTTAGADDDKNENEDQDGYTIGTVINDGVRTNVFTLSAIPPAPGEVPKGNEPLGDNIGGITDTTDDDFSNLTFDIGLKPTLDYGDAPESYGNAGHGVAIDPKVYLGALLPDKEGQPQNAANGGVDGLGDDKTGVHDEDSIQLLPPLRTVDTRFQINVFAHNSSSQNANLIGWIDFNKNGIFDVDEAAEVAVNSGEIGTKQIVWDNIPAGTIQSGELWLRLRISTDENLTTSNATAAMFDGEVEDYSLHVDAGIKVSGFVFNDANVNTGSKESNEKGIANISIVLSDGNTCISTKTNTSGYYYFDPVTAGSYTLYEAANETVTIPETCPPLVKDPTAYRSTTSNTREITVTDVDLSNQDFGDVLIPIFSADNTRNILPNSSVLYAHRFIAKSTGTVSFNGNNTGNIASGWSSIIYQDSNCDGALDSTEASTPVGNNIAMSENSSICLINKVYAPSDVQNGESYSNTIQAVFNFNNNSIAGTSLSTVSDFSNVSFSETGAGNSKLELRKTVQNISQNTAETETMNLAKPGETLKYCIYYQNTGIANITDLVINDVVPEYTVLNGTPQCELPLAVGLTSCSASLTGGNIEWTFGAGSFLKGGDKGMVSYEVIIE